MPSDYPAQERNLVLNASETAVPNSVYNLNLILRRISLTSSTMKEYCKKKDHLYSRDEALDAPWRDLVG